MEKTVYAKNIVLGSSLKEQPFFLADIQPEKTFKWGATEVSGNVLVLQDKTGTIKGFLTEGKEFDGAALLNSVVNVSGCVLKNEETYIKLDSVSKADSFEGKDFVLGLSEERRNAFKGLLKQEIASVKDERWANALKSVFTDDVIDKMGEYPYSLHSFGNYHGGLLVTTAAVTYLCSNTAKGYATLKNELYSDMKIDFDLLYTASLLHGVGKLFEYTPFPFKKSEIGKISGSVDTLTDFLEDVTNLTREDKRLLMATLKPAIDVGCREKATTKEAIILQQSLLTYKLCDEKDKAVFDYQGDENIFYDWKTRSYVTNTKKKGDDAGV